MASSHPPALPEPLARAVHLLRQRLPGLLAVYVFGSRASGTHTLESDWDIAVWTENNLDSWDVWSLSSDLAETCGAEADLVDLRIASTVMQYQVITQGQRVWERDSSSEALEAMVLREKLSLDEGRGPLLQDIVARGKVYG